MQAEITFNRIGLIKHDVLLNGEVAGCILRLKEGRYTLHLNGIRWTPVAHQPVRSGTGLVALDCRLLRHAKYHAQAALLTLCRSAAGGSAGEPGWHLTTEPIMSPQELLTMAEMHIDRIPNKGQVIGAMQAAHSAGFAKGTAAMKAVMSAKPDPASRIGQIVAALQACARGDMDHPHMKAEDYAFLAQYINKET